MSEQERCLGCMRKKGDVLECPKCGYVEGTPRVLPALEPGTGLAGGRYLVGRKLQSGGDGMDYIAFDNTKGRRVILREYFPSSLASRDEDSDTVEINPGVELAYRDYREDFLEVSRAVSRLSDVPGIVPVIDIFECNNTAYAVYAYTVGKPLSEVIKVAGRLSWEEFRPLFIPLISSMAAAHAVGLVHFGLNPDCVILTKDSKLMVSGFGVPDAHLAETDLKADLYEGYSAIEQYAIEGKKGKWTDVYALSAMLFFALTGRRPPDAVARSYEPRLNIPADLADSLPTHVASALAGGLQVQADKRISGMEELKAALGQRPTPAPRPSGGHPSQPRPSGSTGNAPRHDAPRQKPPQPRFSAAGIWGRFTWLQNLSPLQYGILSVMATALILGIIVLCIWPPIRDAITNDNRPVVSGSTTPTEELPIETQPQYAVPSLAGQKLAAISTDPDYAFISFIELGEDFSENYAAGVIISQSPEAGAMVTYGTPVCVIVSRGSKMRQVPDIIGKSVANAELLLDQAGLMLGAQTEEYSATVPMGNVIGFTDPGVTLTTKFEYGSMIPVRVSIGPDPLG